MKKLFTYFLALVVSVGTIFAWDYTKVQIGDLYYNLNATNQTAEVTEIGMVCVGSGYSTCDDGAAYPDLQTANIPATITYSDITYSVTVIGDFAFSACPNLSSVTIPNTVTRIGQFAFQCCYSLSSIVIPASVTLLEYCAFGDCRNLRIVTLESTCPPTLNPYNPDYQGYRGDIFEGCNNCYFYVPCGTLNTYQSNNSWSSYALAIKYAPYPSYTINKKAENGYVNSTSTDGYTICDEHIVTCTAVPNSGFYFVKWADGNEENPRTIELTQDTTMEAIFDYLLEGKCGADNVLTWKLDLPKKALTITGKGALSANYTYGTFIESLTIGNDISVIGQSAFAGCNNLKDIIIGSSVKVLENAAFFGCSNIKSITCYSQRPPTVSNNALYGLDYGTIVYVPKDYLETYKMHDAWGLYDVRPIGATTTETTDVNVNPSETTATIVWPTISGAATYELVIKDKSGNVVCTLIFNAQGQLTQIAFNTPGRDNAPQQTQTAGFSFTVTGLDEGTSYDLTISAKNSEGKILDQQVKSFTTKGSATSVSNQPNHKYDVINYKYILNGQLFIQRGDEVFNAQGARVK